MCAGAAGASAPSAWPQRSGLSTGADSLLTAALRGGPGRLHALAAVSEPGRVDALASPIRTCPAERPGARQCGGRRDRLACLLRKDRPGCPSTMRTAYLRWLCAQA